MTDLKDDLPLDTRLLSDAIIELNISRRNVAIYPRDHPSVKRSLTRAYDFLQKLFELRNEITLAVAKDTIIIDDHYLDKKNPVFREFALHLSSLSIAYVTFISGLTEDEIYAFHRILSEKPSELSRSVIEERLREESVVHIKVGFVDYDSFVFKEDGQEYVTEEPGHLWERYIYGLMTGTLRPEAVSDMIQEIPPKVLASMVSNLPKEDMKEESYDRVITGYIKRSSEGTFSGRDIKKLMDFINALSPELKRQFLSATVRVTEREIRQMERALEGMSVDQIIEFLETLNENKIVIPEALKNLMDKFSTLSDSGLETIFVGDRVVVDDFFLMPEIKELLESGDFSAFVSDTYQKEIQKLLNFDISEHVKGKADELLHAFADETVDQEFAYVIMELLSYEGVSEEDYDLFTQRATEYAVKFLEIGQYGEVLKILKILEANSKKEIFPLITEPALEYFHSKRFIDIVIDSVRLIGRQFRDDAIRLLDYYGEAVIPPLMDALIKEESLGIRRFILSLIIHFKDKALPEVIKRLGDKRWYVKRNMIYLLCECGGQKALPHIRQYCHHEHTKVRVEAVKSLLKLGDPYGISMVKTLLESSSDELVEQGIKLAGAFRLKELVPELIGMLRKRGISAADFYKKIPVVKALGEIGDPSVIAALNELLSTKSLLFRGPLDELKLEIYRSLNNYPYNEDMKELIEKGMRSSNNEIKRECMRLKRFFQEETKNG